ncbi:gamma-glutamylcyclotransferase [Amycolatopsis bullii]|uniref:Gamma-glutamylcyclotransferase n=1 Tax=Amycolatopsis bullii TaxID=941987 RepID=A0ABQ3KEB9_9PSEU|nr:gamma-glutamylcyclotransferase [Amycolatopsis bullii]
MGEHGECVHSGEGGIATLSGVPLYAAYGSNMEPAQMLERAPHSPMAGTGWLEGWRLTFGGEDLGWEGALATIVEDPASRVFVVLYDVTPLDEDGLDRWEGGELGIHSKIRLRVQTMDGSVLAWLYVLDAYEGGLPSARYLGVLADAAEAAGAPADYVDDLRTRPCSGITG